MAKNVKVGGFAGLELGVFDRERPLMIRPYEMSQAASDASVTSFLRRVRFEKPRQIDLQALTTWADGEFEEIARLTGGAVLTHKWGLYDLGYEPHGIYLNQARCDTMPFGYVLAAEVSVVESGEATQDSRTKWRQGINEYGKRPARLLDINGGNFTEGVIRGASTPAEAVPIQHDIEIWSFGLRG